MSLVRIIKYIFGIVILINAVASLKQLHVVFRHGERTPTETYPNDPYINITWPGGWGQLTNRGKLQMYSLGLKLREWYKDFIPQYYFNKDVNVTSSYSDRCLMSAQTLLAALFPPKDEQIWNEKLLWQPIPVHYKPRSEDKLIAMKAKCEKYDEEFDRVLQSETFKIINKENFELYQYLTKHTGEVINNIGGVEKLYNTLEIELLHNLTLPAWTQNVSMEHMKNLAARYLEAFVETTFMKRMKGGVFLKEVISEMKNSDEKPILSLYAAHDVTLVNILKTLNYKGLLKPGFGATLILELNNKSEVSMIYRNDFESSSELITLPNCPSPCLLYDFEKDLGTVLPSDWEKECHQ